MPNTMLNVHRPFSLLHYAKVNNLDPRRVLRAAPLLFSDFYFKRDEFDATLVTGDWTVGNTGTAPTDFAYNAQRNGAAQGATGTTDNNSIAIYKPNVAYDSADNPCWFLRWRAPAAVSSFAFEIGWADAKTDETLTSISALTDVAAAVPTVGNGITDYGLVLMNTDMSLTTAALIGDGTTGSVIGLRLSPVWTPTASGIIDMIIGISANLTKLQLWDSGAFIGEFNVLNGPDSATLVRPSAVFKTLNTTSKTINILKSVILAEENAT